MEQVFQAIEDLSQEEKKCFETIIRKKQTLSGLAFSVFDQEESRELFSTYGVDTVIAVTKTVADKLAETSGKLGLVAYYDPPEVSDMIQFRLRRAPGYTEADLRSVLEQMHITNGGGHPGAVGFRFHKEELSDFTPALHTILEKIQALAP